MRGVEVLRVHGQQLVADRDGFVGLSRFDICHLQLLVNPADGLVFGSLRCELFHQRQFFGFVRRLPDLLEQLPFRRLGVDRAQLMPLGQR